MTAHIYNRPQGRAMDRETVQSNCIFSVTIAGFPVLDWTIRDEFFNASIGFRQTIHTSHAAIFVCQYSAMVK